MSLSDISEGEENYDAAEDLETMEKTIEEMRKNMEEAMACQKLAKQKLLDRKMNAQSPSTSKAEEKRPQRNASPTPSVGQVSVGGDIDDYLNPVETAEGEPDVENSEEGDDEFADFAAAYGPRDATGPPLPDNLAQLVTKMMQMRLSDEKEKALLDSLPRPENVPMLATPRVDTKMWGVMKSESKSEDIKLAKIEDRVRRALIACANLTSGLQELKASVKGELKQKITKLSREALKAVQSGAAAIHQLKQKRRDNIRADLAPMYRPLCNVPKEEGEQLIEGNLEEKVKSISQGKTIGNQLTERSKSFLGQRYQPYQPWKRHNQQDEQGRKRGLQNSRGHNKQPQRGLRHHQGAGRGGGRPYKK
jgi:hypothetical protein